MAQTIDLKGLVRPHLVEVHRREDNSNIAEFRLQPLERGYGHTLGNAMRRMYRWRGGRRPPDHR
jgi:DNA-directed RNA polymerase subunit alpha